MFARLEAKKMNRFKLYAKQLAICAGAFIIGGVLGLISPVNLRAVRLTSDGTILNLMGVLLGFTLTVLTLILTLADRGEMASERGTDTFEAMCRAFIIAGWAEGISLAWSLITQLTISNPQDATPLVGMVICGLSTVVIVFQTFVMLYMSQIVSTVNIRANARTKNKLNGFIREQSGSNEDGYKGSIEEEFDI